MSCGTSFSSAACHMPGSNSTASSTSWRASEASAEMRVASEKNCSTSGMRRYGAVRYDSSSSECRDEMRPPKHVVLRLDGRVLQQLPGVPVGGRRPRLGPGDGLPQLGEHALVLLRGLVPVEELLAAEALHLQALGEAPHLQHHHVRAAVAGVDQLRAALP
eukprot:3852892-Pyramimonas_sp.AAC.1